MYWHCFRKSSPYQFHMSTHTFTASPPLWTLSFTAMFGNKYEERIGQWFPLPKNMISKAHSSPLLLEPLAQFLCFHNYLKNSAITREGDLCLEQRSSTRCFLKLTKGISAPNNRNNGWTLPIRQTAGKILGNEFSPKRENNTVWRGQGRSVTTINRNKYYGTPRGPGAKGWEERMRATHSRVLVTWALLRRTQPFPWSVKVR